jgi:hypothetical protein
MQKVRLSTAQAHILLTDTATRMQGLALLDDTAQLAQRCGLSHLLRAIQTIRLDALSEASQSPQPGLRGLPRQERTA